MVIRIERISAQSILRSAYYCAVPGCGVTATWSLIDLGMRDSDAANLGQWPCCADHISVAYVSLRGAHLVAKALTAARVSDSRPVVERRRPRKRRSIANIGDVLIRCVG
jgi:hypothetical protein